MRLETITNSLKNNGKGIALMLFSALCVAIGQLLWKLSLVKRESIVFMLGGFLFYGLGAVSMTISFRFGKLSILHPLLATSYVFAILLGTAVLSEPISVKQLTAIGIIALGGALIGGSDK